MSGMFEPRSGSAGKRDARYQKEDKASKKTRKLALIITTVFVLTFVAAFIFNSAFIRRMLPAVSFGSVDFSVAEFQYFYNTDRDEYINFFTQLGSEFVPERGRALSAQFVSEEAGGTGETWEEFFLSRTYEGLANLVGMYEAAVEAGFTLSEEEFEQIESTIEWLEFSAMMEGASLNAMLQFQFGPAMNEATFRNIQEFILLATSYSEYVHESFTYSSEELRQYFDENREDLGFDADDYYMPSFRQILISPEHIDPAEFAEGEFDPEYILSLELAEEEVALRAELVYDLFTAAGSTEEALLSLMEEHSDDTTEGGFYENISKEQYRGVAISTMQVVDEIAEWLFYEDREVGDSALIHTEFGFHLVYFTGLGDTFFNVIAEDVADTSMRAQAHDDWLESLELPEPTRRFAFFFVQT